MTLFGSITLPGHPDPLNIQRLDQMTVPIVRRMMRYGMAIDIDGAEHGLRQLSSRLSSEMRTLRLDIASQIPIAKLDDFIARSGLSDDDEETIDDWSPINVGSDSQLAVLLFDTLGIGAGKELKRTPSDARISVNKKQLEQLKKEHPVVQLCLDYAERATLRDTFAEKLPKIAKLHRKARNGDGCTICGRRHWEDVWRVHPDIMLTRTGTGRLAQKRPNCQNIPARTELGRLLRLAFIAEKGFQLVDRDFSQFELRLLAHCSQDEELIRIFAEGLDPHTQTAMRAFELEEWQIDKLLHRAPSKNVNFAVAYEITAMGLIDLMAVSYATANTDMPAWLDEAWCGKFIDKWFTLYPGVKGYMEKQHKRAYDYGIIWTLFGAIRPIPEVRSALRWIREAGERQAGNVPIQGTQADCMRLSMAESGDEFERWREAGVEVYPINTVHDELIHEVEEDWAEAVDLRQGEIMEMVLTDRETGRNMCRVPIKSEGKVSMRWEKG